MRKYNFSVYDNKGRISFRAVISAKSAVMALIIYEGFYGKLLPYESWDAEEI